MHMTTYVQSEWIVLCCLQFLCKELMSQLVECMDSSGKPPLACRAPWAVWGTLGSFDLDLKFTLSSAQRRTYCCMMRALFIQI